MSITKTKQGTFRARYRDATGRQIAKTFKMKADAVVWEREGLRQRDLAGLGVVSSTDTVTQWANQWISNARNLAPGTIETYERDLDRYILPRIGDLRLSHLIADDIDDLLTTNLERGLAPSTVHRHYRTIRRMLQVAVARGKIKTNPCEQVQPPRIPEREMRFLTVPQVEKLADNIGDRYRAWVLVAAYGGLRWGEMLALRPEDMTGNVLDVSWQLKLERGQFVRSRPKSRAGRRKVPLPESVAEELRYHTELYAGETIFVNKDGRPLNHTSFTGNVFKPALVRARLDRQLRIHDLRHSAVAIAIQCGAHPKAIQRRLGHASISVTLDVYGHLMPDMETTLASDMDKLRESSIDLAEQVTPSDLNPEGAIHQDDHDLGQP